MEKALEQIRAFLRGLTVNQRLLLAGSAVLVGLVIWLFVRLFSAADYKNLYTGLDPTDTQKIVQRLSVENISYQISSDGTSIDVPMDKLDRVRVEMASQNLPHTGRLGFELFDKPNWSSSDFSERVNYQRALEAELERTIETMDTVESARVHLVLPRESLFTTEERPAKAAVVVKLRTQRLADETVTSIANLVASAWENLSPDDVTIVSADGRFPLSAGKSGNNSERRGHGRSGNDNRGKNYRHAGPGCGRGARQIQRHNRIQPRLRRDHAGSVRSQRKRNRDFADFR